MMRLAALIAAALAITLFVYALINFLRATRGKAARRIRARLEALTTGAPKAAETSLMKDDRLARTVWMERLVAALPRAGHLKRLVEQAGVAWTAETFFATTALAFFLMFVITWILTSWLVAFAVGAAAAFLPLAYLYRQRSKRLELFENQFPETLDLISRALRAGHAFGSGLKVAGEEGPEPLAAEFRTASEEINFGLSLPQALLNFAERVPLTDVRFFVTAVLIQRETGGNLTEILGNISTLVRERLRLFANIRVLSAEGRMSAWILIALPIGVAAAIHLMNPGYLRTLFIDPLGTRIMGGVLLMTLVGIFWIRRIIKIRV